MIRNSAITFIILTVLALSGLWYAYAVYYPDFYAWLGGQTEYTMFIDEVAFRVQVADDPDERRQGLSGTSPLSDQTGMLFIFEETGDYGFWMKDMQYAIDIIWLNESYEVVHVVGNATPDSYPKVFGSPEPARFVLEVPAFTAETFDIELGDTALLPVDVLPQDLQSI
jgi:uncharacterized membrane protein (UPF0127 family)